MLLSVENLHVYYGAIHAVKDVSLHVQEGEIVTLIGAIKSFRLVWSSARKVGACLPE